MSEEGYGVSLARAAVGEDLGGSSKHSAGTAKYLDRGLMRRRVPRQLHLNEG